MSDTREMARGLTEKPLQLIEHILVKHHEAMVEELRDQVRSLTAEIDHLSKLLLDAAITSDYVERDK